MQSSTLFVLFALFSLLSFSSAASLSSSSSGSSSSSSYPAGRLSSSSAYATSSSVIPAGSVAVYFIVTATLPTAPYYTTTTFVVQLTADIAAAIAAENPGLNATLVQQLIFIEAINGVTVAGNPGSRRLLAAGSTNFTVAFVIEPTTAFTFNPTTVANTFATQASLGNVSLPTSGATVPVQALPTVQVVGASSSTGTQGSNGASKQASGVLAAVALAASVALLL